MLFRKSLFIHTAIAALAPFDADAFMGQTYDAGAALDTVIAIPPAGDYRGFIGEIESDKAFRTFEAKKGNNIGKEFTVFQPLFVLEDHPNLAEVKAARGTDRISVAHKGMFLDLTDAGGLDFSKGKNVDLGRLLEAIGMNPIPAGFNFKMMEGKGPVMVHVIHETDPNDDTKKYARVSRVVKIS